MNINKIIESLNSLLVFGGELSGTWIALGAGFFTSFSISFLIVITKSWHGGFSMDINEGIQKFHTSPTPRVGGLAVFGGLLVAWFNSPEILKVLIGIFMLAGLPAFIFGIAEDITKKVSVLQRLVATMASGLLAWYLTDCSLTRVDVWVFDALLANIFLSIVFTSFAVGGVANSINIIDGFNGLASTTSTFAFISFALIAQQVGDVQLASLALVLAACVWGFFWINWPFGKIFLGDGGAYFVGFCLGWIAVMLIERNSEVSAFSALLVCAHPITEVIFSIFRRKIKSVNPGHPDRMHFHSLIKQRYMRRWFSFVSAEGRNSITGLLVGLITMITGIMANFIYQSVFLSSIAFFFFIFSYVAIYGRMVRFKWCSPISFLFVKPQASIVKR